MDLSLDIHLNLALIITLLLLVLQIGFALQLYDFLVEVSNNILSLHYPEIHSLDLVCYERVLRILNILNILIQSGHICRELRQVLFKDCNLSEYSRLLLLFARLKELVLVLKP